MRTTLRRLLATLGAVALVTTFFTASPVASAEAADTAYPTLSSVTMQTTTVAAGSSIVAVLDASDDVAIATVALRFVASGSSDWINVVEASTAWLAGGSVTLPVPAVSTTGPHNLDQVTLTDTAGKVALQTGDFNGDRKADLVAVDTAGRMWLYPGTGRGGFGARSQIGNGWGSFGAVLPLRDFNGDGRADIGAITMDGKLLMDPGNGRSGFLAAKTIGTGWGSFL